MDHIQAPPTIHHLVQVYQPPTTTKIQNPQIIHISHTTPQGKVAYQQTITSESLHIPVTSQDMANDQIISQNQIVMSCQQHLHTMQPIQSQISSQVLQGSEMGQSLHVLLPQVPDFKQHMLVNEWQYEFLKEQGIITKVEPEVPVLNNKQMECKTEKSKTDTEMQSEIDNAHRKKRMRSQVPNPNMWACNIRKQKHQRGEAYISRRGKFVPERTIKNTKDCLKSCKMKCSVRVTDADREHIFKAFYSLNANEKKHYLLNTTERHHIKHGKVSEKNKRQYSFKYYFLIRSVKYLVCKNFYLGTLAISQKPVYNVHRGKSDMNIPKPDGRGLSETSVHSIPTEIKDRVRKHIMSFPTLDAKPVKQFSKKKQYLESNLSIKQMYTMYLNDCGKDNILPVKESMYRKIFKQEFNLHFPKTKDQLCCKCKGSLKKK